MVWKLIDQLGVIKDINVRAMTLNAKLDDAGRAELQQHLQRCNDRRMLLALKLVHGQVSSSTLSDFAVWLALQGQSTFERVVENPDALAEFDEIGAIDKLGQFKFKGPTRGPKWSKEEARTRLANMLNKYSKAAQRTSGNPSPPADAPSAVSQLRNDEPDPTQQMPTRASLSQGGPLAPAAAEDETTVQQPVDEVGAALKLLRILFRSDQVIDMEGRYELHPKYVHGIYLVTIHEGPKFARPPHSPEGSLLWKSLHQVKTGETIAIDGVGALSKTEREAFSGFDPLLGRERTVPAQTVYTLRLNLPGAEDL